MIKKFEIFLNEIIKFDFTEWKEIEDLKISEIDLNREFLDYEENFLINHGLVRRENIDDKSPYFVEPDQNNYYNLKIKKNAERKKEIGDIKE
jgi:hypothetical protein